MKKIDSKLSYYNAMAELETLLLKGISNLTEAEDLRLDELTDAVEEWDKNEYPTPLKPDFVSILLYVMEANNLNQTQLASQLNISPSFLSSILSNKKSPNTELLKEVHIQFQIDGNMLLESV